MRNFRQWMTISAFAFGIMLSSMTVFMQSQTRSTQERIVVNGQTPDGDQPPPDFVFRGDEGANGFYFLLTEMSFNGRIVKGAPYTAQSVTESTQTLADGNRIVHKNTASVYRDSEGRTRREQTLEAIGPFANAGDPPPQSVFINDPVAGVNYILEPRNKIARKVAMPPPGEARDRTRIETGERVRIETNARRTNRAPGETFEVPAPPPPPPGDGPMVREFQFARSPENIKTESLGRQTIEGVEAEGTRTTITIPAGDLGNEKPILIVNERWYSTELQTVVMSKHTDPRFGETTFRLTGITRGEQPHTLFEIPSDYTIKEERPMQFRMKRPQQ